MVDEGKEEEREKGGRVGKSKEQEEEREKTTMKTLPIGESSEGYLDVSLHRSIILRNFFGSLKIF